MASPFEATAECTPIAKILATFLQAIKQISDADNLLLTCDSCHLGTISVEVFFAIP